MVFWTWNFTPQAYRNRRSESMNFRDRCEFSFEGRKQRGKRAADSPGALRRARL